jgi:hypothetical protein
MDVEDMILCTGRPKRKCTKKLRQSSIYEYYN